MALKEDPWHAVFPEVEQGMGRGQKKIGRYHG